MLSQIDSAVAIPASLVTVSVGVAGLWKWRNKKRIVDLRDSSENANSESTKPKLPPVEELENIVETYRDKWLSDTRAALRNRRGRTVCDQFALATDILAEIYDLSVEISNERQNASLQIAAKDCERRVNKLKTIINTEWERLVNDLEMGIDNTEALTKLDEAEILNQFEEIMGLQGKCRDLINTSRGSVRS